LDKTEEEDSWVVAKAWRIQMVSVPVNFEWKDVRKVETIQE
jgi:hypothetical protein